MHKAILYVQVKSVHIASPGGDKINMSGSEVPGAFTFLASRLKSTTVQRVTICFREVTAKPNSKNQIG